MSDNLDRYLHELRRELRRRGLVGSRIVEELRCHVLDAVEAAERQGIPPEAAVRLALERVGPPRTLAVAFATERSLIMQRLLFAVGLGLGLSIGYVDSRPSWDDTGITAGLLLLCTTMLGGLAPQRPWLWALCVGLWIPVFEIYNSSHYGSLLALAVAFIGAYGGMLVRRAVLPT